MQKRWPVGARMITQRSLRSSTLARRFSSLATSAGQPSEIIAFHVQDFAYQDFTPG
jgi:hypothetical protein